MQQEPSAVLQSCGPDDTYEIGRALGLLTRAQDVIGLTGDLGAGKTRLAQGIANGLGVPPNYRVTSPSFTLINEYPARVVLAHIDLYRLGDIDEMAEIGLEHYLGGDAVCVVEWVERCEDLLPEDHLVVRMVVTGDEARRLEVFPHGNRHERLVSDWSRALKTSAASSRDGEEDSP